jgi:hypothetical protein
VSIVVGISCGHIRLRRTTCRYQHQPAHHRKPGPH